MRSNWMKPLWLLTLTAAVLLTSAAFADTVVMTPDNMATLGWSLDTYFGAIASLRDVSIQCAYPISKDPADPTKYIYNFASPAGGPLPYGALYGETRDSGSGTGSDAESGQVWLGTNQFSGRYLRDITKLEYDTWTLSSGQDLDTFNHFVKQPFMIHIAFRKNGPTDVNWRYIMFRPWGTTTNPEGFNQLNPYNTWEGNHWNAMSGVWYDLLANRMFPTFQDILTAWPNAYIDTPPGGKGTGYEAATNLQTGTGYSFNLQVGARKQITNVFGLTGYAWWQEGLRFVGCADNLTIGVRSIPNDPTSDPIETTYDFEPAQRPAMERTLFIKNLDAKRQPIRQAKYANKFVVAGYVQPNEYSPSQSFLVGEANTAADPTRIAGSVIKVKAPGTVVMPGDFVVVKGMIDDITTPALLMSNVLDVTVVYP